MAGIIKIQQGESLPFSFDRDGEDISGWTATISIKQYPADTSLITPRVITPTGEVWSGFLTQTETAGLSVSSKVPYSLIAKLSNGTTDEETQIPVRFHVSGAWV